MQILKGIFIPIIEGYEGKLIKMVGDSFMVYFNTVYQAFNAVLYVNSRLKKYNRDMEEDYHILLSSGIGYGEMTKVSDKDIFGFEVNLASKLGEDIADA